LAGTLAGLVLPVVMTRSLSLAPVPDPSSGSGSSWARSALLWLSWVRWRRDPLSAQAQWPSRPSGGNKEQQPAKNEGGAGASFCLAVDRAKIAADRHRQCPYRAHKSCASKSPQGSRIQMNSALISYGTPLSSGTHGCGASLSAEPKGVRRLSHEFKASYFGRFFSAKARSFACAASVVMISQKSSTASTMPRR